MTNIKIHIPDAHLSPNAKDKASVTGSGGNNGHQNPGSSPNGGGGEMG